MSQPLGYIVILTLNSTGKINNGLASFMGKG
jgi:hypothetical protein